MPAPALTAQLGVVRAHCALSANARSRLYRLELGDAAAACCRIRLDPPLWSICRRLYLCVTNPSRWIILEHSPKMDQVSLNSNTAPVCTCRLPLPSQSRKKSFAGGLLSRTTTDASFPSLARRFSSTSSPSPLESPSDSSNDKGPLGLTTLYEPLESAQLVVDLVFIHGLGGGSRKTWSLSPNNAHYWPQAWLPDDEDFSSSVRIHTFSYKAD